MSIDTQKLNQSCLANSAIQAAGVSSSLTPMPIGATSPSLRHAMAFIQSGDHQAAVALLRASPRDLQTRNTLGVCLMRAGVVEEPLRIFRAIALVPGSVQERFDLHDVYRRNFAISLLLNGLPGGALDVLAQSREPDHVMAARIRAAIKSWENSLSFWRRFDWRILRVEPRFCNVPIDFEPGEFDFHVVGLSP